MAMACCSLTLLLTALLLLATLHLELVQGKPRIESYELLNPTSSLGPLNDNVKSEYISGGDDLPEALRRFRFNAPARTADEREANGSKARVRDTEQRELAEIVLVITVDGAIHAVRRDVGLWIWSLHDENGDEQQQDVVRSPLVKSGSRDSLINANNKSGAASISNNAVLDSSAQSNHDDEVYIIEPHSAGDIYVYHRLTSKLQRLPLSVSQLVDLSPFTFPNEDSTGDGKLFVGRKETKLVGIDLQTGALVGVFGPDAGWCEWLQQSSLKLGNAANDGGIKDRPWDLLYLGRTDYHISIYSKAQGLLQTLSYTAYGPSSLAGSTNAKAASPSGSDTTWQSSLDDRYIQPMHDGSVVCFHANEAGLQWTKHFSQPVIGIYDIVYPSSSSSVSDDDSEAERLQPVLQVHPHQALSHDSLVMLRNLPPTTFIGKVRNLNNVSSQADEEYFAMSNRHYPLVSFAPSSPILSQSTTSISNATKESSRDTDIDRRKTIVGSYRVEEPLKSGRTIDASPSPLGIEPPPSASPYTDTLPNSTLPTRNGIPALHGFLLHREGKSLLPTAFKALLPLSGLLVVAYLYLGKRFRSSVSRRRVVKRDMKATPVASSNHIVWNQPEKDNFGLLTSQSTSHTNGSNGHSPSTATEKALPALPPPSRLLQPVVTISEAATEMSLDIRSEADKADLEGESAGDDMAKEDLRLSNKKKGRRRKRGRRPPARAATYDASNQQGSGGDAESTSDDPDRPRKVSESAHVIEEEKDIAGRVGSLTISDKIIGKALQP